MGGPKGVSVLMFANREWRKHQFFAYGRWNGGLYATTTIAGSRPGNIIVATWAVMKKMGTETYRSNAKQIIEAVSNIKKAIRAEMPEISYATDDNSVVLTIV